MPLCSYFESTVVYKDTRPSPRMKYLYHRTYSSYIFKDTESKKLKYVRLTKKRVGTGIRTTFRNAPLYLYVALTALAIVHFAEGEGNVIITGCSLLGSRCATGNRGYSFIVVYT
jgi:hypothetical protein